MSELNKALEENIKDFKTSPKEFRELAESVEYFLKEGFVPQGGICVVSYPILAYYQAMVKYKDLSDNPSEGN